MVKFLASDVDGTLYVNGEIPKQNLDAVRKFREAGNIFMLCTGRSPESVLRLCAENPSLECDGAILAGGGALYKKTEAGWTPLEQHFIDNATALQIISHVGSQLPDFTAHWNDGQHNYCLPGRFTERQKAHPPIEITLPRWEALHKNILLAIFSSMDESEEKTLALKKTVLQKWGSLVEAHHNNHYLDVSSKGRNKEYGFTRMAQLLGNPPAYAVGDGFNDAPMFKGAGKENSFLMKSGAQDLLSIAGNSVQSVAECIEILLNN